MSVAYLAIIPILLFILTISFMKFKKFLIKYMEKQY
jgi:hypothetical protein